MVHAHATPALIPGVGSLDDPASGQDDEASDGLLPKRLLRVAQGAGQAVAGAAHDLDPDAMGLLDRPSALTFVCTIGVEPLDGRSLAARLRHDFGRAIAVLHAAAVTVTASSSPALPTCSISTLLCKAFCSP